MPRRQPTRPPGRVGEKAPEETAHTEAEHRVAEDAAADKAHDRESGSTGRLLHNLEVACAGPRLFPVPDASSLQCGPLTESWTVRSSSGCDNIPNIGL